MLTCFLGITLVRVILFVSLCEKSHKTSIKKLYSLKIEMQVMSMLASLTKEGCNVTLANKGLYCKF